MRDYLISVLDLLGLLGVVALLICVTRLWYTKRPLWQRVGAAAAAVLLAAVLFTLPVWLRHHSEEPVPVKVTVEDNR